MTVFLIKQIEYEGKKLPSGDWKGIKDEAAKYHRAKVEVTEYDPRKEEISEQQRRWLHSKAGPIRKLVTEGWSFREAKEHIKVEYGRQWFVVELTDENFKNVDGVFRWECRKPLCRKLIHPMDIVIGCEESYICQYCGSEVYPIALKSIMDVSVKNTNKWFAEIFAHMKGKDGKGIEQPDPEWEKTEKEND